MLLEEGCKEMRATMLRLNMMMMKSSLVSDCSSQGMSWHFVVMANNYCVSMMS